MELRLESLKLKIPKRSQSFNSRNLYTLSEEKNSAKNVELFCQSRKSDDYFYQRLIFTDKYSYRLFFFCKREHLVFANLKIPLVYLFDWKFD